MMGQGFMGIRIGSLGIVHRVTSLFNSDKALVTGGFLHTGMKGLTPALLKSRTAYPLSPDMMDQGFIEMYESIKGELQAFAALGHHKYGFIATEFNL